MPPPKVAAPKLRAETLSPERPRNLYSIKTAYSVQRSAFRTPTALVGGFVGGVEPELEGFPGLVAKKHGGGDGSLIEREGHFAIEKGIVEVGSSSVGAGIAEPDTVDAGPVDGGETHGARLTAGINFSALEAEDAEGLAGGTDGTDLAVSGGIVVAGDAVGSFAKDEAFPDDDGTERPTVAGANIFSGESDGSAHELRVRRKMHCGRGRFQISMAYGIAPAGRIVLPGGSAIVMISEARVAPGR